MSHSGHRRRYRPAGGWPGTGAAAIFLVKQRDPGQPGRNTGRYMASKSSGGGGVHKYGYGPGETLTGTSGNDTLIGGDIHGKHGSGIGDTIYGGGGNNSIVGQGGNDVLYGGSGNDTITAGDGNDYISGGSGSDLLYGGAGNDTIVAGAGDTVDGGSGTNVLDLSGSGAYEVVYDPANPLNGTVIFVDAQGNQTGSLSFSNISSIVSCFTPGTLIATAGGETPVEELEVGNLVRTRDHGLQPVRWVGRRTLSRAALLADPTLRPVRIAKGALGEGLPLRDMAVSRQHRMLVAGPRAALLFGEIEVLVRALHLVHLPGIAHQLCDGVTYVHILFDRHELVLADGAWSESYQPGVRTLAGIDDPARDELFRIFPELACGSYARFDAARITLKGFEARALLSG